jgi:pimeloyl-ACP methyl ester carboxylesterase
MSDDIDEQRRRFFVAAAGTIAAAQLGLVGSANAQAGTTRQVRTTTPATSASFAPLKQIEAGLLNVGYAEAGPTDGPPVILLHGWPYDIHTYVDVAPLLASAGYRVIVPYLRGYGTTRFLSAETARNGQQSVVAVDIIALMDALKIEKATIGGCDWGALQRARLGERLPDREPGIRQGAPPARDGIAVVVPILFRDRTGPGRLRQEPARLREAYLADRLAEVGLRRRYVRAQRGRLRQSGPRRHRHP